MTDAEPTPGDMPTREAQPKAFWDRHAKLSILLIAASFYVVLIAMCATIGVLVWLRY